MKRNYLVLSAIVIILTAVFLLSRDNPITNYPPPNSTIVAFGDSLIQGVGATPGEDFVSKLSQKIGRPIVNLGFSGDTSAQGLARIEKVLEQNPGTVIVLLGGNDYLRRLPKEQTFNNLRQIIAQLQQSGSMVVLLGIRGGAFSDNFKGDFKKLARETGVVYISNVLDGLIGDSRFMSDAVHPNSAGYEIIAQRVADKLGDYLR